MIKSSFFSLSSLRKHILNVVFLCTNREMFWINARRIVTLMQDIKANWNRPIMDSPRKSMRLISFFVNIKRSISMMIFRACPFPATFSFFDMFPKTFFWWFYDFMSRSTFHTSWRVMNVCSNFSAFDTFFIERSFSHV